MRTGGAGSLRRALVGGLAAVLGAVCGPAWAQDAAPAGEEVVLALTAPEATLADAMIGYQTPEGVLLPLGELARALDLAIAVGADGRASGWFISEARRFELDPAAGRATSDGRAAALPPGSVVVRDGDVYVRTDVLEQLLPLKLRVDLASAVVRVEGAETLPFQARLERQRRRLGLGAAGERAEVPLTYEPTPYRLFTAPAMDVDLRATAGREERAEYDVRLSGDLAFMAADLFVAGDEEDALSNARFRLGRVNPDGMGRFGLTEFGLGDVFSPDLPNGVRSASGRGFLVSNAPLDSVRLDRVDVRGELPAGYEAELYRNGVLIGSQASAADGRYEFRDVPLVLGENIVRVVLYGPRGETREEVRRYRAGGDLIPPGQLRFRIGAVQVDRPVFDVGREENPLSLFDPAERGEWNLAALAEYGLGRRLSVNAHLGARPDPDRTTWLTGAGLRTDLRGAALRLDGTVADDGSAALSAGVLTRLAGVNLALEHAQYTGGFLDDRRSFDNEPLNAFTGVRADVLLGLGGQELPVSLAFERREQTDGDVELRASARTSALLGPVLVSNGLQYERTSGRGENEERLDGSLDLNAPLGDGLARLALDYRLSPETEFENLAASYDRLFGERLALRLGVSQQLSEDSSTRLFAAVTRRFSTFDLSLDGEYDTTDDDLLIGVRLSTSLFWDGGRYRAARPGFATGGAAAVRIFRDLDADGRRDPGEPPVQGVRVGPQSFAEGVTDARGVAVVRGLGANRRARVTVDVGSVEDPFEQPNRLGFEMLPRPGRMHPGEIGLLRTAEIETSVVLEGEGGRPLANVDLELVDAAGKVAAEARSEFDGFVLFDKARPGTYRIRLQPDQARRLGLEMEERAVTVAGGEDVVRTPPLALRGTGAVAQVAEEEAIVFRNARFRGATLLDAEALEPILAPYKGRTVTLDDLRVIASSVEAAHADAGFPFVAVIVPPQDVKDGLVEFEVVEGRVSDLTVLGNDPVARRQANAAFAALVDRHPLPLSEVEEGYEQARAVPGLAVAGSLRRGSRPGGMDLVVQARRRAWRTYVNVNNLYPDPTGPWGVLAGADYNGRSTHGDQTTLQLYTTLDPGEQTVLRASHFRRLNARGTALSLSGVYAEANPGGEVGPLDLATGVEAFRAEIEQPLVLRPDRSLAAFVALDWSDQETRVFRSVGLTEDRLRVLSGRLVAALGDADQLRASVEVRKGLEIGDASRPGDPDLSRAGADPQGWLVRASATAETPPIAGVSFSLRLEGQYSPDSLAASEEFTVGNLSLGRGYEPGASYGDRALGGVFEARLGPFEIRDGFSARPFAFYDAAQVWNDEAFAPDDRLVASTGLGLRLEVADRARFDLVYAVPLSEPLGTGEGKPQPRVLFNLTTSLGGVRSSLDQAFRAIRAGTGKGEAPR